MKNFKKLTVALMLALGSTFAMTSCGETPDAAKTDAAKPEAKDAHAKDAHSEADHSEADHSEADHSDAAVTVE